MSSAIWLLKVYILRIMKVYKIIKSVCKKTGLSKYRENIRKKRACSLLRNIGEEALQAYFDVGIDLGATFVPMFGTLLGIYRNHDFIAHDDDIDMVLDIRYLSEELLQSLQKHGFVFDSIYVGSDFKGCQLPMKYKGLTCDIYFSYFEGTNKMHIFLPLAIIGHDWEFSRKLNLFRSKDVTIPFESSVKSCKFRNKSIGIPQNTEKILISLYGDDFMIPKKNSHADPNVYQTPLYVRNFKKIPIDFFKEEHFVEQLLQKV